jgi:nondiscriminating aspartyl-tRNA synthetase
MQAIDINPSVTSRIDFAANVGKSVTLLGMVQNVRPLAWGGFVILRTPSHLLQCVVDKTKVTQALEQVPVEATVRVSGEVKAATIKDKAINPRDFELQVSAIEILGAPTQQPLPIDTTKKEMLVSLDNKLDLRPLTLRHVRERAVFRVQAAICNEFGRFLTAAGFTRICTPKIVFSGAEGGANIFQLDYFGRKAFLAQSPQFYKQMMVGVFGRVFETGPVFRAEKHNTSRHINEYTSLDFEMQLDTGFLDIIQMEANLLNAIFAALAKECGPELELLGVTLPKLDKLVLLEFDEVHEVVFKHGGMDHRGEDDLAPEEEQCIGEYAARTWNTEFVFVTHYPTDKRPFYTMPDPERPDRTFSFDLLFRGMEITTGGRRLNKYEDYIERMKARGMNPEAFASYLQAFKFGMPPHGGLGLGLERLTARLCGIANIKEATLFPRDVDRLEP